MSAMVARLAAGVARLTACRHAGVSAAAEGGACAACASAYPVVAIVAPSGALRVSAMAACLAVRAPFLAVDVGEAASESIHVMEFDLVRVPVLLDGAR